MIRPENIISITKRDVGLGYYIDFDDGRKIKISRKRNVFPLFYLLFYPRCAYSDITKESKMELYNSLKHVKGLEEFVGRCNAKNGFEELRQNDRFSCIKTQNLNGKIYFVIPRANQDELFVKQRFVEQVMDYDLASYLDKQNGICNICKLPIELEDAVLDFRVPKSRGGDDNGENIQVLCKVCFKNKRKKCMPCVCVCDKDCKLAYPEFSSVVRVLEQK